MTDRLFINACVRPESRTYELAQRVFDHIGAPTDTVTLAEASLAPLDADALHRRDRAVASRDWSAPILHHAQQFAQAREIVIAAPYWDLAFPALLRIYLEHVTACGVTFKYSPEGVPVSLCQGQRLIYVTTAGGPIGARNFGYDYVHALATTFYGIERVQCFQAENLDIVGADPRAILQRAMQTIDQTLR